MSGYKSSIPLFATHCTSNVSTSLGRDINVTFIVAAVDVVVVVVVTVLSRKG